VVEVVVRLGTGRGLPVTIGPDACFGAVGVGDVELRDEGRGTRVLAFSHHDGKCVVTGVQLVGHVEVAIDDPLRVVGHRRVQDPLGVHQCAVQVRLDKSLRAQVEPRPDDRFGQDEIAAH